MIDVDRGELVVDWGLRVKRRHKFQGLPGLEKALEKAFPKAREPRAFKETREYYGF